MQAKKATTRQVDQFITKMIRKSSKAPAGFHRIRRVAKDTARDIKRTGKGWGFSWGLLALVAVPILVVLYIVFTRGEKKESDFELGDKAVDLKDRDVGGLLGDFGHSKPGEGGQGQPGRPFDEG